MILLFSVCWILYQNLPNYNNWRELQVYVNLTISTSLSLYKTYKTCKLFMISITVTAAVRRCRCIFYCCTKMVYIQWTHLCWFAIDSTSKFRVESSSIFHRNYIHFERRIYVEIMTSVLDVDISTWIRLSKSTKCRWGHYVEISMPLRCQIDVTSVLAVSILSFSNICCSGNLF